MNINHSTNRSNNNGALSVHSTGGSTALQSPSDTRSALDAMIERAKLWVADLGRISLNHGVYEVPRCILLGNTDRPVRREEPIYLTMLVNRDTAAPSILQRIVGAGRSLIHPRPPFEDPTVTILSKDVRNGSDLDVHISTGSREKVMYGSFGEANNAGIFSGPAGQRAEAYAKGAFLGLSVVVNPSGVRRLEMQDKIGPTSPVTLSETALRENLQQVYAAISHQKVHGVAVLPTFVLASKRESCGTRFVGPLVSDMSKPSNRSEPTSLLVYEVYDGDRTFAKVSLDVALAAMRIEMLDKSGNTTTQCLRTFGDLVSATAATVGATHVLRLILKERPPW